MSDSPDNLQQVEKATIERVLAECGGRVYEAAKRLSIAPTTLYRKLAVMGAPRSEARVPHILRRKRARLRRAKRRLEQVRRMLVTAERELQLATLAMTVTPTCGAERG